MTELRTKDAVDNQDISSMVKALEQAVDLQIKLLRIKDLQAVTEQASQIANLLSQLHGRELSTEYAQTLTTLAKRQEMVRLSLLQDRQELESSLHRLHAGRKVTKLYK